MKLLASLTLLVLVAAPLPGAASILNSTNAAPQRRVLVRQVSDEGSTPEVRAAACQPHRDRNKEAKSRTQTSGYDRAPRLCDRNEAEVIDDRIK